MPLDDLAFLQAYSPSKSVIQKTLNLIFNLNTEKELVRLDCGTAVWSQHFYGYESAEVPVGARLSF